MNNRTPSPRTTAMPTAILAQAPGPKPPVGGVGVGVTTIGGVAVGVGITPPPPGGTYGVAVGVAVGVGVGVNCGPGYTDMMIRDCLKDSHSALISLRGSANCKIRAAAGGRRYDYYKRDIVL